MSSIDSMEGINVIDFGEEVDVASGAAFILAEMGDAKIVDGSVVVWEAIVSIESCSDMMRDNRFLAGESMLWITEAEVSMMVEWRPSCCKDFGEP
jgi:hypothetical protein